MTSTNFPTQWPNEKFPLFQYKETDRQSGIKVYHLNKNMVLEDDCHIFFPTGMCEGLLIAKTLESHTFHPDTKLNDAYKISSFNVGNGQITWCSFPKEYTGVCERIAQVIHMKMKSKLFILFSQPFNGPLSSDIKFPEADNILWFEGKRCGNKALLEDRCNAVKERGNGIQELDID